MAKGATNGGAVVLFPSKKDWWLGLILGLAVFVPLAMQLVYFQWIVVAIELPVGGFLAWIWFGTGYTIDDQQLVVRSGPFVYLIPLESIRSVRPTRNPFSSPALSLDRLAVRYNRYSELYISPANKEAFIAALRERCPQLEVVPGSAEVKS